MRRQLKVGLLILAAQCSLNASQYPGFSSESPVLSTSFAEYEGILYLQMRVGKITRGETKSALTYSVCLRNGGHVTCTEYKPVVSPVSNGIIGESSIECWTKTPGMPLVILPASTFYKLHLLYEQENADKQK